LYPRSQHCTDGGRTETDDDRRLKDADLALQPAKARGDLAFRRRLVQAARAPGGPAEMLDRIGDEGFAAIDAGLLECLVENFPGGSHERKPREVFLVARLLADEHDPAARWARARNG